jgi:hypothetical protein
MMAHDRDRPSKRIARLIKEAEPRRRARWTPLHLLGAGLLRPNPPEVEESPALSTAFEAFGLDPNDPDDRWQLLRSFAEAHFSEKQQRGAKLVWKGDKHGQLFADFLTAKKETKGKPKAEIYKFLANKKKFGGRYAGKSESTLRKRLRYAPIHVADGFLRSFPAASRKSKSREDLIRYLAQKIKEK